MDLVKAAAAAAAAPPESIKPPDIWPWEGWILWVLLAEVFDGFILNKMDFNVIKELTSNWYKHEFFSLLEIYMEYYDFYFSIL